MTRRWQIARCFGWVLTGGVAAAMGPGCAVHDQTVISSAVSSHQQLAPAVMNDADINAYFSQLGARIVAAARLADKLGDGPGSHKSEDSSWMFSGKVQFHLVNSKTLNAFTTGGEHVYVYNALLQLCKSEDELAAVMSHEFAHIYCRHVQQGMRRQYYQLGAAGTAALAGYVAGGQQNGAAFASAAGGGAAKAAQFLGMGYTRHDEGQADEFGFQFYCLAGWDPRHFGEFFQAMIDAGYDKTPTYLSDHPMLKDRVVAARQRAAEWVAKHDDRFAKPPLATPEQFAAMKARAAQLAAATPDDASLKQAQGLLASFSSCVSPADEQPEQVEIRDLAKAAAAQQQQGNGNAAQ